MEENLRNEVERLRKELAKKEAELEIQENEELKALNEKYRGKCYRMYGEGFDYYFFGIKEVKKTKSSLSIEAEHIIGHDYMRIGHWTISYNREVFISIHHYEDCLTWDELHGMLGKFLERNMTGVLRQTEKKGA